jgi:hypothetical protein
VLTVSHPQSHFTELKYGLLSGASGTSDNTLRWMVNQVTQWSTPLVAGTWYNFAYDIDFSAGKVGLWASQGSAPLTQVVAPVSASASSNGADWHVGVLRLPNGGTNAAAEDFFWSGLYIENGSITTSPFVFVFVHLHRFDDHHLEVHHHLDPRLDHYLFFFFFGFVLVPDRLHGLPLCSVRWTG